MIWRKGQHRETIIFVHPKKGEQLWDFYIWRFPENQDPRLPDLITFTSKRCQDNTLDVKMVLKYYPLHEQYVWSWRKLPYHIYVRNKAILMLQMGVDNLEMKFVEGREQ